MGSNRKSETSTRDKLMLALVNSQELVRDFRNYSNQIDDSEISKLFAEFAEDEGFHAAKLKELLDGYSC